MCIIHKINEALLNQRLIPNCFRSLWRLGSVRTRLYSQYVFQYNVFLPAKIQKIWQSD